MVNLNRKTLVYVLCIIAGLAALLLTLKAAAADVTPVGMDFALNVPVAHAKKVCSKYSYKWEENTKAKKGLKEYSCYLHELNNALTKKPTRTQDDIASIAESQAVFVGLKVKDGKVFSVEYVFLNEDVWKTYMEPYKNSTIISMVDDNGKEIMSVFQNSSVGGVALFLMPDEEEKPPAWLLSVSDVKHFDITEFLGGAISLEEDPETGEEHLEQQKPQRKAPKL